MASSSGSGCGTGTSDPTSPPSISCPGNKLTDGWDNEEWGSLDEEPVNIMYYCSFMKKNYIHTTIVLDTPLSPFVVSFKKIKPRGKIVLFKIFSTI